MAKRKKNEERELMQLPPQVNAAVLAVFTLLALLGGLGILWQTWQVSRAQSVGPRLESLRQDLVANIDAKVETFRQRLQALALDSALVSDVEGRNFEAATARVSQTWPELKDVGVFDPSLDAAFSTDLARVGFSKLALLTSVAHEGEARLDVVGRGDALDLGMAVPIKHEAGAVTAVVYGAMSLADLTQPVSDASLPGGFMELRSGQRVLVERGDSSLRYSTKGTDLSGIPLRLATAAPGYVATLPYSTGTQLMFGLGALFFAVVLGMKLRKAIAQLTGKSTVVEPTMADTLLAEGVEPAPKAERTAGSKPAATAAPPVARTSVGVHVDRSIFRAYDIRGVVGKTLNEDVARLIGQAIGTVMNERGLREIVVGRDGRLSGPEMANALIEGLRLAGRDVIDIGQAPTPLVYFAAYHLQAGSCVAVTGSHNPPDYNGFKIVLDGETLATEAIDDLYFRIADRLLDDHGNGGLQSMDVSADYIRRIADDVLLERKLKVVVDAGNGVAGGIAPQVLEAIGAEVVPLYCEVDGQFPNHHPDPSDPHNLTDLIQFVQQLGADLGLAFDGDGDRLGVVTRTGEIIFSDRVLMLFARDVLSRAPGATIIYDVKCTGHLAGQILRNGGSPIMWKTGHSLIKAKMRETEAELAGEMSGHFFFRERWYGFDDGIYAAARLLEILAADGREPEEIFEELPKGASTPELKVEMKEGAHYAYIEKFVAQAQFDGARISNIDGVRADWHDGWGLVRCSNTTPSLVLRFDADDEHALARIQNVFREQMLAVDSTLILPF
jgi:phosphomannomutase/phosphoglucomutase